jgi:NAD(P)-dependent dehydrogenase (short-subunit alcohol dehydrogenase family)
MAAAVHDFADLAEGERPSRGLLRAQVGRPRGRLGDTLVSITGAGSGIGRETAFAFVADGAEVVDSDIDEAATKDTAAQIATRGDIGHACVLDVSDAGAVESFAEEVCTVHGLPDIVVNNAGIGQVGGSWTPRDTPPQHSESGSLDFRGPELGLTGQIQTVRSKLSE